MKTTLEEVKKFNLQNVNKMRGGITNNPVTIQEKLRWLNIYDIPWSDKYEMPLKSVCADKLLVKEYVKELLGVDICVPTITVYNNTKEIEWDKLPNKFIIKVNHNSGGTIICRDKNKLDKTTCISKLNFWMSDDFTFRNGFESHYHWIDRKIMVEELLEDESQKESLFDYKFWCFNGEPQLYTINDGHGHGDIMYYRMDDSEYNLYKITTILNYKKPKHFNLMTEYARKISSLFKFVRVDFYEVNGRVYLGELTFVPGAALFHYKLSGADTAVGALLNIKDKNNSDIKEQTVRNKVSKKNFLIIHYNTPKLTECLVKSINKFVGTDCSIYIFDNSDKAPFTYKQDNITIFDNTHGQIINFDKELKKYPNHIYSLGSRSRWGSFKHCISVDKCFDLIDDSFVLLDSDVLLKRDVSDLFDENVYASGEIIDWSWNSDKKIFPVHKRIRPFITFINVNRCKTESIRYYNDQYMVGLYDSTHIGKAEQMNKDSYDTGCWFYEEIQYKPIKEINHEDYVVHFRGGSYLKLGGNEKMTQDQWLNKYSHLYNDESKKKVIYTCITGGYDNIIEPAKVTNDYDYVCFTDDISLKSNVWEIRQLPEETKKLDNVRKNRYIKTHPHILFPEYETSIYVDGSIKILGDLNNFVKTCDLENNSIIVPKHPCRTCIYKEAKTCISIKKDTAEHINPQIERYRKEGFPENYGLTQNNIIVRKHNDENCIKVMEEWWQEILNGSYRDQLSLMYVLWKNHDVKIKQISSSTCDSSYFKWYPVHTKKKTLNRTSSQVQQNTQEVNNTKQEIDRLQRKINELKKRLNDVKQTNNELISVKSPSMTVLYRETENGLSTQKKNITKNVIIREKKRINKSNLSRFF